MHVRDVTRLSVLAQKAAAMADVRRLRGAVERTLVVALVVVALLLAGCSHGDGDGGGDGRDGGGGGGLPYMVDGGAPHTAPADEPPPRAPTGAAAGPG